jgi:hypothetical protein
MPNTDHWEQSQLDLATRARMLRILPDEWEQLDWGHIFDVDSLDVATQRRLLPSSNR